MVQTQAHLVSKKASEVLALQAGLVPLALTLCYEGPHDATGNDGPKHQRVGHHIGDYHPCKKAASYHQA